jgi:hypothetical protein
MAERIAEERAVDWRRGDIGNQKREPTGEQARARANLVRVQYEEWRQREDKRQEREEQRQYEKHVHVGCANIEEEKKAEEIL